MKGKHSYSRCENKAKRLSKALQQRIPNVTFMIAWKSSATGNSSGEIVVFPGSPPTSKPLVSSLDIASQSERMRDFHTSLAILFSKRLKILWNGWSDKKTTAGDRFLESVQSELVTELRRYLANATWPDCIHKAETFKHLVLLRMFLEFDWLGRFNTLSIETVTTLLGKLLHLVNGNSGVLKSTFTFATPRNRLRVQLSRKVDLFLQGHYGLVERRIAENLLLTDISRRKKEKQNMTDVDGLGRDFIELGRNGNIIIEDNELRKLTTEQQRLEGQRQEISNTRRKR